MGTYIVVSETTAKLKYAFDKGFTKMDFKVTLKDFVDSPLTMVHLHCGTAGTNGGVVADLMKKNCAVPGGGGVGADCTLESTDLNDIECEGVQVNTIASLYQAIRNGSIYMNVHSQEYPQGVVRGQIFV